MTSKDLTSDNALGNYLRDRRARLAPETCGYSSKRRRTPGLRREEVAQRANISPTWYMWLEQGRGGTPSEEVLDGIAQALALSAVEREHLFLLARHSLPQPHYQDPAPITPQLQRALDALEFSPAYVRTQTWDVLAWNKAATRVLTDYSALAPEQRNVLRLIFCDPRTREKAVDWKENARFSVAAFRAETARAGARESVAALVKELCASSPEFAALWHEQDVHSYSHGTKHLRHPVAGLLSLEYSAFAVDGRPDLSLIIFIPATPEDKAQIKSVVENELSTAII